MNQKRSHQSPSTSQSKEKTTVTKVKEGVNSTKLLKGDRLQEQLSNPQQINSLPKILGLFKQDSAWRYFKRGLFWGGLVSLTSILSALCGIALTKVDLVEQQISQRLPSNNSPDTSVVAKPRLTSPLQILLVEVEPEADSMIDFSKTTKGLSKTILLLKINPELNSAQAINIPLNAKTQIPGFGTGTIKDAYQLGGMKLLSQAITQLPGNLRVERYLRTTPAVFQQLSASGQITLKSCDPRIEDCFDKKAQVIRQQDAFETIRQRFNIPNYFTNFEKAIVKTSPKLDTNISFSEITLVANFIKELEPEAIRVDLLPGYTPGKPIKQSQKNRSR